MNAVKGYLLSITAAALLLSLLMSLIHNGKMHRLLCFVGSLLMVLAVIRPVVRLDAEDIELAIKNMELETKLSQDDICSQNNQIVADIIKEQCQTYILDKAAANGQDLTVEIIISEEGDYPYPVSVVLYGDASQEERERLEKVIEQDIGIPPERQEWQ